MNAIRNSVIAAFVTVMACGAQSGDPSTVEIQLAFRVVLGTPPVYVTGNIAALGPWDPDALRLRGDGNLRTANIRVPANYRLEYKVTLGSWAREAVDADGIVLPNFVLDVRQQQQARHDIVAFKRDPKDYMADWRGSGVLGKLVYWPDVASAFLTETRHVEVWLPPGYDENAERHYRVIYMSDGQNLFDPRIANTGVDWGVDEAMLRGVAAGLHDAAIVVGSWSTAKRTQEYSPWHDAPDYARFLIEELMPRVNSEFRTLTGPRNTSAMGSSMGGLLSFYLVKEHSDIFGACGCVSTHFPISDAVLGYSDDKTPYVLSDIAAGDTMPLGARPYFDYGTKSLDAEYGPTHNNVRDWLLTQGFVEDRDFRIREYAGADHNEASWRARLDDQLDWLLSN